MGDIGALEVGTGKGSGLNVSNIRPNVMAMNRSERPVSKVLRGKDLDRRGNGVNLMLFGYT